MATAKKSTAADKSSTTKAKKGAAVDISGSEFKVSPKAKSAFVAVANAVKAQKEATAVADAAKSVALGYVDGVRVLTQSKSFSYKDQTVVFSDKYPTLTEEKGKELLPELKKIDPALAAMFTPGVELVAKFDAKAFREQRKSMVALIEAAVALPEPEGSKKSLGERIFDALIAEMFESKKVLNPNEGFGEKVYTHTEEEIKAIHELYKPANPSFR